MVIRNIKKHMEDLKKAGYTSCTEPHSTDIKPHEFTLTSMEAYKIINNQSSGFVNTGLFKIESCMSFSIEAACESFRVDIMNYMRKLPGVAFNADVKISEPFTRNDQDLRFIVAAVNGSGSKRFVQEFCIGEDCKIWAICSTHHKVDI